MSASLTATVPDTLLPAVQAPQVKHVKAGTHDQEPRAQAHMYTAHWYKRVTHSVFPSPSAFTLTRQTAHCMLHTSHHCIRASPHHNGHTSIHTHTSVSTAHTHSLMYSTASAYFIPCSISAMATRTGALEVGVG